MARVPTFTRRITPSGRVGGVTIPESIADTGEGLEAQGLAALGRGISDIGIALAQIAQAEGTSQFATARAQSNKRIREFELETQTINDPSIYRAGLTAAIEEMEAFRPKSAVGSKMFDDFLAEQTPAWEAGTDVLAFNKTKDLAEGAYISNLSDAIVDGDVTTAEKVINEAATTGVITNEKAARDLATVPSRVIESQVKTVFTNASRFMSAGDFEKAQIEIVLAEAILNDPDAKLDPQTELVLRSRIKSTRAQEGRLKQQEIEQRQTTTQTQILSDIYGDVPAGVIEEKIKAGLVPDAAGIFSLTPSQAKSLKGALDQDVGIVTSNSVNVAVNLIVRDLEQRRENITNAVVRYNELAPLIKIEEGKGNIERIFAAEKAALNTEQKMINSAKDKRLNYLKDAIRNQPNFLFPEEADEFLEDLANKADIEFSDKFPSDSKFTTPQLDEEVNRLLLKYSLGPTALSNAINEKQIRSAETLGQQQVAFRSVIKNLNAQGKKQEAKDILDEAISLGIFTRDGGDTKLEKDGPKKVNISKALLDRILERFKRGN